MSNNDLYSYKLGDDPAEQPAQINSEHLGPAVNIPFARHQSPSRAAMATGYAGQSIVPHKGMPPVVTAGMEDAYTQFTFMITMERDGEVVSIYYKNRPGDIRNAIIIFVGETVAGEPILFHLETEPCSIKTPTFGFTYVWTKLSEKIRVGARFNKGDCFAHSPSICYEMGYPAWHGAVTPRVLMISDLATGEDSIKFCAEALEMYSFDLFNTTVVNVGTTQIPLNLYGDKDTYKAFPNPGETVRDDGIVFAMRTIENAATSPPGLVGRALTKPDLISDVCFNATPGAEVISVVVLHDDNEPTPFPKAEVQLYAHFESRKNWMEQLYQRCETYKKQNERAGRTTHYSEALSQLLTNCYAVVHRRAIRSEETGVGAIVLINKHSRVAPYRVVIVVREKATPGRGFKFSDRSGSKGVQGFDIVPRAEMPFDDYGRHVDVMVSTNSTVNRQNPNRDFEHFVGGVAEKITRVVLERLNADLIDRSHIDKVRAHLRGVDPALIEELSEWIMEGYAMANSTTREIKNSGAYPSNYGDKLELVASVVRFGASVVVKHDDPRETKDIMAALDSSPYSPERFNLRWRDKEGKIHRYDRPMLVAPMQVNLLNKLPREGNAQSTSPRTPHDSPSGTRRQDLPRKPIRVNGSRTIAESEGRMTTSMAPLVSAYTFNLSHSWDASAAYVKVALHSRTPSNMGSPLKEQELGKTRVAGVLKHILNIYGIALTHIPDE